MNPKLIDVRFFKHLSGVVSNLEHVPLTHQNENKIAYERKANENLKFSNVQNHKKSYSKNNFSNYFTFFANRNK